MKKREHGPSPDRLGSEYVRRKVKLTIKKLGGEMVLVEGCRSALEFLGRLLIEQAHFSDCGFQMFLQGSATSLFNRDSTLGDIHSLPALSRRKNQSPEVAVSQVFRSVFIRGSLSFVFFSVCICGFIFLRDARSR